MQNKNKYQGLIGFGVFLVLAALVWWLGARTFQGAHGGFALGGENTSVEAAAFPGYPVMIMIDNSPESQPYHSGLSEALVVYETLAEGGSTRLEALFAGAPQAPRIGPVRSTRPYFVQIAAGWGAFYWHAGGSPEGLALLKELVRAGELANLNEISGYGPIYLWRDQSLTAPHNLFTSGEKIGKALTDFQLTSLPSQKLVWRWGEAEKQAKKSTATASSVAVAFSPGVVFNPSYEYDAKAGVYKRFLAKREHKDYNTGKQFEAANVIIQKVPAEWFLPSGYDRIGINLAGEGEALFFRDGKVWAGSWKKADKTAPTEWILDGEPFILKRGQTWVEIVPGAREVSYQ